MLTINLIEHNNYGGQRIIRLQNAMDTIGRVINSEQFKDEVLNFTTDGQVTFYYRKTVFGKEIDHPYSNQEVYEIIMAGVERYGNTTTGSMDLYLTLLNGSDGNVIGFGNPGSKEIFTYSVMFDSLTIPELVNHYSHEWCHKLGFDHSFHSNRLRNYSVPYGIGNIAEKIAENIA
jgi:hypothetical protein